MKKLSYLLFACTLLISSMVFADNQAMQKFMPYVTNFHSMEANFSQNMQTKKGEGKHSSGKMALQRPGKFRWEIDQPNKQVIIADGKYLWIYDIDLEQATRQPLEKSAHSPASLLSGSTDALRERFEVISMQQEGNRAVFKLRPKIKQDLLRFVTLVFEGDKLAEMSIDDQLGQKNIFKFSHVQRNPKLSPSLFIFHAPKNVEIIKN